MPDPLPLSVELAREILPGCCNGDAETVGKAAALIDARVRPLVEALQEAQRLLSVVEFDNDLDLAAIDKIDAALKAAGCE